MKWKAHFIQFGGPYSGYSNNIDKESSLFNRFQPLQKCIQTKYVPNSFSDLYVNMTPYSTNKNSV